MLSEVKTRTQEKDKNSQADQKAEFVNRGHHQKSGWCLGLLHCTYIHDCFPVLKTALKPLPSFSLPYQIYSSSCEFGVLYQFTLCLKFILCLYCCKHRKFLEENRRGIDGTFAFAKRHRGSRMGKRHFPGIIY